jgi:lysozyme
MMDEYIKGIDVSRWQGTAIDWEAVRDEGYRFAFVKVTDGSAYKRPFIDMGIRQAEGAKAAGLEVGYYHFAHPHNFGGLVKDATDEAGYFLQTLEEFPKADFPLVLDLEDEKNPLTREDTARWVESFRSALREAGFEMMLYASKGYLARFLPEHHVLGDLPLWLAYYPKTFSMKRPPTSPAGWAAWDIWQYTDRGQVRGIAGNVDLNVRRLKN